MSQGGGGGVRSLAVASLAFLTGGVASKALGLLTVPILARVLTPGELGLLDIGAGLAATVTVLAVLGSDNAVARFLATERRSAAVWGAASIIVIGGGAVLLVVGLAARTGLAWLTTGDGARTDVIAAALVHGVATAGFVSALNVIRLTGLPRWYAVATTVTVVMQSIGGIAVAVMVPNPMAAILVWWAVTAALATAAILFVKRPRIALPAFTEVATLVRFGAPLVPAAIAWTVGDLGIRGVVAQTDVGLLGGYSIASRIVSVMALAISGFAIAWMPFLLTTATRSEGRDARDGSLGFLAAVGSVGLAVSAFAPELVLLLGGDRYQAGGTAVAPLSGGMLAFAFLILVSGAAAVEHRTLAVAWASMGGAAVQVALGAALVPGLLLRGAAVASLAGYAVAAILLASRVDLRTRVDAVSVMLIGATTAGLAAEWVLVLNGASLLLRSGLLALVLATGVAMIGPRLRRAWIAS